MERGLSAYRAVLRLVRRLPPDTRPYYSKFARENFVNYRQVDNTNAIQDLFQRAYAHSTWILQKYSVDQSAADRLKEICCR
ncbi:LYR motif-containing protein [Cinnamomum micranthum f. kanehirae]|uniref:LYR motif-containing protein n=1 Tax=Cinnamomum micranthum f. kanehirae TaxID=337451 RepID=A0A3S3MJX2_9MAGN|nr:LYR motif-containing protein [Cinnamomum micranthum f. kanehirae]